LLIDTALIKTTLFQEFKHIFADNSNTELKCFFAPGRVNLIGEHLDYNGGNVFPCAIHLGTYAVASRRVDTQVRLFSLNFKELGIVEFELSNLVYNPSHAWANYPKGVMSILADMGYTLTHGLDILIYGDLPNGAGLSSSASLEVLTALILNTYGNWQLDLLTLVKAARQAENKFIGVNCGIMDQFASAFGRKNHALLLNCDTLEYQYIPLELGRYSLVIANTNKRRGLADSKYNERKSECDEALHQLQSKLNIASLCELDLVTLNSHLDLIAREVVRSRVRHVVTENIRTVLAAAALTKNNIPRFGALMSESHISLRNDYAVAGLELDALVNAAWQHPACIGARMTGAGFGGCTVNLVLATQIDEFISKVGESYTKQIGYNATFYAVKSSIGAQAI
jgi:galactokinase